MVDKNFSASPPASDISLHSEKQQLKKCRREQGKTRLAEISAQILNLRLVRAMQRYGAVRGNLLAGGIAYTVIFTIAGVLTLAFTFFSFFLGSNREFFLRLTAQLNSRLPGLLQTPSHPEGLINPENLIIKESFPLLTILSLLLLLWSALSLMTALRLAIQSIFGIAKFPATLLTGKLWDLGGFFVLGFALVTASFLTGVTYFFGIPLLKLLGFSSAAGLFLLRLFSLFLSAVLDGGVLIFLFRFQAQCRPPRRDLLLGAAGGGVAITILRTLGTAVISAGAGNPLLASFAALATLLLWANLTARITLIAAAFTANPPAQLHPDREFFPHIEECPNYVTQTVPATLEWPHDPFTGVILPAEK